MAALYRRKSLEKLSSPEQLDKLIVINSPLVILALAGGAFIIIVTLLWSMIGRVPITEEGQGILLSTGELTSVYSKTQGVIVKSYVSGGDKVEAGDVLYEVKNEETAAAILQLDDRISELEAVTLDSQNDKATGDNSSLLEIKQQISLQEANADLNDISISDLETQYELKRQKANALYTKMQEAEKKYYDAMAADDGAKIEYEYSTASTEYQSAESLFQSLDTEYKKASLEADNYKSRWDEYETLYEENKDRAEAAGYYTSAQEYKQYYEEAERKLKEYKTALDEAEQERDSKKIVFEEKKVVYENYINGAGNAKSDITKLTNEYNNALSLYSSAKAEADSYESQIESAKSQEKVDVESQKVKLDSLKQQFNAAKEAAVNTLKQEKENYETLQDGTNIIATVSGTVYTTYVANGSTVMVDSEVARINMGIEEEELYAVYYMPVGAGKNVKPGMDINIYPSNVSKEEYGHMKGEVVSVANYVTSHADLYTKLGDESLAATFSANGSVIEVICRIKKDENTKSGFMWSSKKGGTVDLSEGMFLEGSAIIEDVAPITMLIPKLKEKLHIE